LAVVEAAAALRAGEADRALAVGHDAPIEPQMVLVYHQLGLLSSDGLWPFDTRRSGSLLGEGAAALVLETEAAATARDARVLGEFLGSGCATDAKGLLAILPDGDGLAGAILMAFDDAGIGPRDVGMIVAHGSGTRPSDASEAAAIHRVFGATTPPVTAFKWAFGHPLAASGTLDAVLALITLRRGVVPGVATLRQLDPDLGNLPVSAGPQVPRSSVALVLNRGFGGSNTALLLRAAASEAAL
jgi:3-oxoacyl-[acyl-carrier-protein] synthase-1